MKLHRRAAIAAILASCAATRTTHAETLAFPGAEGAGRYSTGGRGGGVIKVTNLNDSGPGSLRAAIESKGPRTVIFDVSGTIELKSKLQITEPNITIAGQTAPGDGVTLRNFTLHIAADDVVIRFIRSRLGDTSGEQDDALSIDRGRRIIVDHVSTSWSVDETLSVSSYYRTEDGGPYDVTVQWSIIAESLNASLHDKGQHGYGTLTRGGRGSKFSFHHNLWASHSARMPRPGNYTDSKTDPLGAYFDFRNNVFYNWGGDSSGYNADTESLATYNFVGNVYVAGPNSKKSIAFKEQNPYARAYFADNAMNGVVPKDPWSLVTGVQGEGYRLSDPMDMPEVRTDGWNRAYAQVMKAAGASKIRDAVDRRVIEGVESRSHRIVNSQKDVGGWPVLRSAKPPRDSDGDGIPDSFERKAKLNPNDASDGNADRDNDGYTQLEEYLHSIVE